uniref:mRNA-decapping enzyme 1B n=1 Tax=Caligus clemensi TaxID=344056 RepID=C1C225_CALCM|nr:mRNA-decapping enzyme 1B [Caligus clemensi]
MADEMKMNFKALKRVDPYIEKIEDFATQVALYKYASSEWEKLDIEGTLFVNRRQDDPKYGFIILNRLSDKNLVEPVTKELDFQVHTPFLLYKNKEGSIFGIWFFDPKECERIHKKMESYVRIVEKRVPAACSSTKEDPASKASTSTGGKAGNIIQLLQKVSMVPMPPGSISMIPIQGFPAHPVHVPVALHQSWQQQQQQTGRMDGQGNTDNGHPVSNENAATQRLFSIPGSYPLEMIERSQRGDNSGASTPHFQPITPGKAPAQQKLFKAAAAAPKGTEPELMSPMAFAHNPGKKSEVLANDNATTSVNGIHLNEGQLVQAMKHLLANDSTFVTKLHKAYLEVAKSQ